MNRHTIERMLRERGFTLAERHLWLRVILDLAQDMPDPRRCLVAALLIVRDQR